jgi:hypothetical protein
MAIKQSRETGRARQIVAQEAARLIVDHGIRDYRVAKRKAAGNLGFSARGLLPGNTEIEAAVADHLQLFGGESQTNHLRQLRVAALSAMGMLASFTPRLVGPVLAGTADENSAVNLHVFADSPEDVATEFDVAGVRFRAFERRLKSRRDQVDIFAGYSFHLGNAQIEATIFPVDGIRQAPMSPIDGKPMRRATTGAVQKLLDDPAPG